MLRNNKGITSLLLIISICLIAGTAIYLSQVIVSIPYFEHGRTIVLYDHYYNGGLDYGGIAYRAWDKFTKIGGTCAVYNDTPIDYHFEAVYADNQETIGIVDYGLFKYPLVMCNFKVGKCYPCDNVSDEERNAFFNSLQRENSKLEMPEYWN